MDLYSAIGIALATFAIGALAGHAVGYGRGFHQGFHFGDRRTVGSHITSNPAINEHKLDYLGENRHNDKEI